MANIRSYLESVMQDTATSLKRSMDVYWSADERGENDLPERNLSIHFAHQLLVRGFYVYAEANHHLKEIDGRKVQGIDTLAISPNKNWWIACEFKNYRGASMIFSLSDLERVASFKLGRDFDYEITGEQCRDTVERCAKGIGLVAGLTWLKGENRQFNCFSPSKNHAIFSEKLAELGGDTLEPIKVRQSNTVKDDGAYFLLSAIVGDREGINWEV